MPVGKELGTYSGTFSYVRYPAEGVVEGSYTAKVTGDLAGTATGTMTFTSDNVRSRGTCADLGAGYLASGDVVPYKGAGAYWSTSQGNWETRIGFCIGDQPVVSEGQINLKDGVFSLSGKLFELT